MLEAHAAACCPRGSPWRRLTRRTGAATDPETAPRCGPFSRSRLRLRAAMLSARRRQGVFCAPLCTRGRPVRGRSGAQRQFATTLALPSLSRENTGLGPRRAAAAQRYAVRYSNDLAPHALRPLRQARCQKTGPSVRRRNFNHRGSNPSPRARSPVQPSLGTRAAQAGSAGPSHPTGRHKNSMVAAATGRPSGRAVCARNRWTGCPLRHPREAPSPDQGPLSSSNRTHESACLA